MLKDNPARRLHDILKDIHAFRNTSALEQWNIILKTNTKGEFYSSLAKVIELTVTSYEVTCRNVPKQAKTALMWYDPIHKALINHNPFNDWQQFSNKIPAHSLVLLNTSADFLDLTMPDCASIDSDRIQELRNKAASLLGDISSDNSLHLDLSTFLRKALMDLIYAIDRFQLTGVDGLHNAIDRLYGHAYLSETYRDFVKTEKGSVLISLLSGLANCVSIMTGIPLITSQVDTAFAMITSS